MVSGLSFGTVPGTVVDVAQRFGIVRDTNWGRLFDVRSVPRANDLAYTAIPLGPHTDNPYRDPTPGIQLLHCLVNETTGGLSTLVDAVAVCDVLRDDDPEGFHLLATVPVQFRFVDATDDLRYVRTVVQLDGLGLGIEDHGKYPKRSPPFLIVSELPASQIAVPDGFL